MTIPRQINIIDMYHGNNVQNGQFAPLRDNGVMAIIHKASQGLHFKDPSYMARRDAVVAAGMFWGAYHFLDNTDAEAQAEFFIKCSGVSDAGAPPTLLACDFEKSASTPTLQTCLRFMKAVDQLSPPGTACVLYSGDLIRETLKPHTGGFQESQMQGVELFFQSHRLWLAEYGPKEQVPWPWNTSVVKSGDQSTALPAPGVWLWQYTEKGRVAPLAGFTDGNFYDGSFDDLGKHWLA